MSDAPHHFSGYTKTEPDPLAAVIDRQLEIERKARAWDLLRQRAVEWHQAETVAELDTILANA